ncbi:hypothetical protein [Conexibacter sp. W3-3-2]|nr:hypothetical protein [Conexibacter sp. W3-3-2]
MLRAADHGLYGLRLRALVVRLRERIRLASALAELARRRSD